MLEEREMNDAQISGLNWQQSAIAYREIAALKEEIAKRDAEIARLNDRIEAYSIDLAVKEGKVKS